MRATLKQTSLLLYKRICKMGISKDNCRNETEKILIGADDEFRQKLIR